MAEAKFIPGVILNAYPDSLGGSLSEAVKLLRRPELRGAFSAFYLLPSLFHHDLDRGFSVIDYGLNERLAAEADLRALREDGITLLLDFVLNHASVRSPQFRDILEKGDASEYRDLFLDWNRFWAGHGEMTNEGYIQPDPALLREMFFRKPGLPLLTVRFPDGRRVPFWNTFYQEVREDADGQPSYLGQMDFDVRSPQYASFCRDTLETLHGYGASVIRLDAFAYAHKEPGARNFLNEPGTWELLEAVSRMAQPLGLTLLPEIHASYAEGVYALLGSKGFPVYDFFLPGLILDAFELRSGEALAQWASEIVRRRLRTVNMLGCHDGIPLLDLKGLLPEERIQSLIETAVGRGGIVKDLHGQQNVYYQVNAAYFSALGSDESRLLLARAVQLFMPGTPQIWYLDLFAGTNDLEAVRRGGTGAHKEINRTNLSSAALEEGLKRPVVRKQLELLKLRSTCPVFSADASVSAESDGTRLRLRWENGCGFAQLDAELAKPSFSVSAQFGTETVRISENGGDR